MQSRRRFLRDAVGVAAASSLAGCSFANGSESTRSWLADVADTRATFGPSFLTAYTCDPVVLRDELGTEEPLPQLARNLLANVAANVDGTAVDDVDRLTGQFGQDGGHTGEDLQVVRPGGAHVLATGDVDVDSATTWLSGLEATDDLGEADGFHRYGTGGDVPEAFVVDDGHVGYGNRQGLEVESEPIADAAVEAVGDDAPVRDLAPALAAVADEAAGDAFTIATQFDLVAERPDTGTAAFDAVASSLLAAGVSVDVDGSDCTVERLLRYRRDEAPSVDAVEDALAEAAETDAPLADADWSVRRSDRTVVTSTTVQVQRVGNRPEALRSAFPIPALEGLSLPIDPRTLGRTAPPRVSWEPALDEEGRLRIVHGGGPAVEDLVVRYVADGEDVEAAWSGPVEADDAFTTERPPDGGTLVDLVWAPGTVDETILLRIEV